MKNYEEGISAMAFILSTGGPCHTYVQDSRAQDGEPLTLSVRPLRRGRTVLRREPPRGCEQAMKV